MMRALRIIGVTMFILSLWHLLVVLTGLPAFILPSPARVGMALIGNLELIAHHASVTMAEVMIGLLLGAVLGVATAISLAQSPIARVVVRPMMVLSQALPVFALAPVLTLWLGYGFARAWLGLGYGLAMAWLRLGWLAMAGHALAMAFFRQKSL